MKSKKRVSAILLACMTLSMAASACGRGIVMDNSEEAEGKTTISVSTYNKGVGKKWLEDAARRFELLHENTPFEEGKKGVYIDVQGTNDAADILLKKSLTADIYFTELMNYMQYINESKVAPITDVVQADLKSVGEQGKTIEGKLAQSQKDFLTAKDGDYYALPFYDGFMGFVYDVDVFETNLYYFDEQGEFVIDLTDKSKGIDGVAGTLDDGLPRTYAEFEKLVDHIRLDGKMSPFVYATKAEDYYTKGLTNWWADYEGKEKMQANWALSGEIDYIEGFNVDGTPIIKQTTIDSTKGMDSIKMLQAQPGKYYALQFLRDYVMGDKSNHVSASDYLMSQYSLIRTGVKSGASSAAMLMEGVWWENEADKEGKFSSVYKEDLNAKKNGVKEEDYRKYRRFAFMPIPKVSEDNFGASATKTTLYSGNDAYAFISSNSKGVKLDVAKEFLKFLHTDKELSLFSVETSIPRALTYTMDAEDKENMTYFGKSVIAMKENADIVYPYSNNEYYLKNAATFILKEWCWKSKIGGAEQNNPFSVFVKNEKTTAKDYFEGLIKVSR